MGCITFLFYKYLKNFYFYRSLSEGHGLHRLPLWRDAGDWTSSWNQGFARQWEVVIDDDDGDDDDDDDDGGDHDDDYDDLRSPARTPLV